MNSSARLLIQIGAQPERSYPIERDITILGREAINDMVVNDAEVSRRHTRIMRQADGYLIEDLGSTNGTFVNGKRVTVPTLLYHGDVIDMGKSAHLTFQLDQPFEQVTKPIQMEENTPPSPAPPVGERSPYAPPLEDSAAAITPSEPDFEQQAAAAVPSAPQQPQRPPARPIYEEAYEEYEEADSAEFYRPPAADPVMVDGEKASFDEDEKESGGCQRYFMTCGCLSLLFIFLLVAALFILDHTAPAFLYCGPLQAFWETVLDPILRMTGRVWVCPS